MFYDSRNMPIVIENAVGLSWLYLFRVRGNVVHKNVDRAFQVVALKEHKSARDGSKTFFINSVNDFHARRVELEEHEGHGLDVLWLCELVANLDRHRSAAKREQERRGRGLQHDIRPDAFNAPGRFGQ